MNNANTLGNTYRWDVYFRCPNPNKMALQLPVKECSIILYTARNFDKWYWGYHSSIFFEDNYPVRLTNDAYASEREARYAAIEMLIDCVDMAMWKVNNECWCKTDSCGEVELGWEEILEMLEKVKARLEEYRLHHDADALFDM